MSDKIDWSCTGEVMEHSSIPAMKRRAAIMKLLEGLTLDETHDAFYYIFDNWLFDPKKITALVKKIIRERAHTQGEGS